MNRLLPGKELTEHLGIDDEALISVKDLRIYTRKRILIILREKVAD